MIFRLKAPVKDYIWGGTRLRDEYGKKSGCERIAESWELSCHNDGLSIIETLDIPLVEYLAEHPEAMGENCRKFNDFPILIKLIDARDNLSVQVHPDEKYALEHEGEHGKTEMWYVIDCEPDSSIIYGLREKISRKDLRSAIENNTLMDKVNIVPVHKGDVFMIRAGTLHAIGKGCLIAEIQQSSNVTYRVYDYGRPRELHIDKALDVANRIPATFSGHNSGKRLLARCKYFRVYREIIFDTSRWHDSKKSFTHVLILDGEGKIWSHYDEYFNDNMDFKKGDSFFITAGSRWQITGDCSIIYTMV
ncbi:MAG: class I mannose-6-phosphate isomerase [Ruminococcus sp.]|nr:class I mannose-6-phosphate isomerase [Ruminococcus sp.]